mmetsp:Transcript_124593/g.363787  ORF Transcript_124593/g.363787 Transcript_124593/m.363787 type:complete len:259 (-) Transcript_124593:980-1756(-)
MQLLLPEVTILWAGGNFDDCGTVELKAAELAPGRHHEAPALDRVHARDPDYVALGCGEDHRVAQEGFAPRLLNNQDALVWFKGPRSDLLATGFAITAFRPVSQLHHNLVDCVTRPPENLLDRSSAIHNFLEMDAYELAVLELQTNNLATAGSDKSMSSVRIDSLNGDGSPIGCEKYNGIAKVGRTRLLHYANDELLVFQKPMALFLAASASMGLHCPIVELQLHAVDGIATLCMDLPHSCTLAFKQSSERLLRGSLLS